MYLPLLVNISAIIFACFASAIGHGILYNILPIRMEGIGISTVMIGSVMAFYSFGTIASSFFGTRLIKRVGHIRIYTVMAAILAIISIGHMYIEQPYMIAVLRVCFGFSLVINYITLESWLTNASSSQNRSFIFSVYQIIFAIGFGTSPFIIGFFTPSNSDLFSIIALCFCASLIPLGLSSRPAPDVSGQLKPIRLKKLWRKSKTAFVSTAAGGFIVASTLTLTPVFVVDLGRSGVEAFFITLILASFQIGSIVLQMPVGFIADKFDKRLLSTGISIVGVIANFLIVLLYLYWQAPILMVVVFIIAGGISSCVYPLSVSHLFDFTKPADAPAVMEKVLLVFGCAGVIGPICVGYLMDVFDSVVLYVVIGTLHLLVGVFTLYRYLVFPRKTKYETTFQLYAKGNVNTATTLRPVTDLPLSEISDPEVKLLALAIKYAPDNATELITTAFENNRLSPEDVTTQLILYIPRQADILMKALMEVYPERRLSLAKSLHDLFVMRKERINQLIVNGLLEGADDDEENEINSLIEDILRQADAQLAQNS